MKRSPIVVRDYAELGFMRAQMARDLGELCVPAVTVHDLLVVATELVTNGFMHSSADSVTVQVEAGPDGVTMSVAHDEVGSAPERPVASRWDRGGRGLQIVDSLCDRCAVEVCGGTRSTEIRVDVPLAIAS